jgi:F-type H+-transporting ATPase subunit b
MSLASVSDGFVSVVGVAAAGSAGAVEVDFDATVVVQVVLFVLLMVVLKPILFDPMLRLFEERERRIEGAVLEARKIDEASAKALTKYEDAMAKVRATANAERDKMRAEGMREENAIIARARDAAAKTMDDGRRASGAAVTEARTALVAETPQLARELASRVLGREIQT